MKIAGKFTFLPAALLFCLVSVLWVATVVPAEAAPAEWFQTSLNTLAGDSSQVLLVVGEEVIRLHGNALCPGEEGRQLV